MATAEQPVETQEQQLDKGLKSGALGLISTTVIATASVAPAHSIAAPLVFVVGAVALQAPAVAVLAFVPMLLTSIGYSELNRPTRTAGPRSRGRPARSGRRPAGSAAGPSSRPTCW